MSHSHQIAFGYLVRRLSFFFGLTMFALATALPHANAAQSKRESVKVAKHVAVSKKTRHGIVSVNHKTKLVAKIKTTKVSVLAKHKAIVSGEVVSPKLSFGQMAGLHDARDELELKSSVALVIDQDTSEVLFSKNDHAVLPIASLTKLMTGLILSESRLPMNEMVTISQEDVDTEKGSSSRLRVGAELTRGELLHLALMSSENRAAHALGRSYPGGLQVFVGLMNAKARLIGMNDTRYVEPTGLSSNNQSSARDLVKLVNVAYGNPTMRELSTSPGYQVAVGNRVLQYNNTNRLVKNPSWDIGLQKTGFITEAGQCLVMQAKVAGRKLIMVFLDSAGKLSRIGDAERVRHWVESMPPATLRNVPLVGAVAVDKLAIVR